LLAALAHTGGAALLTLLLTSLLARANLRNDPATDRLGAPSRPLRA